ncbi:MAG: dihydrolipoamide acetyltransferase family protein, partial [Novosphingobium sp.]
MGTFTFRLPDIGEGIAEAEIVTWHVKVGDRIEEDGKIADVMTDTATVELESPVSGVVLEVAGAEGDMIAIGSPLVVIETDGEGEVEEVAPAAKAESAPVAAAAPEPVIEATLAPPPPAPAPAPVVEQPVAHAAKVLASPAVRARAADLGIDLAQVKPAEDGRIRHADLDAFLAYNAAGGFRAAGAKRADQQVKVIGLRRRISENMAASKRNIPHFSYVEECDATALEEMRTQLNAARGNRPKLTLLPLLITALCRAMPDFPMLNARFDDEAGVVTRFGSVHLGMATQTDGGLMVPVIRDAQDK